MTLPVFPALATQVQLAARQRREPPTEDAEFLEWEAALADASAELRRIIRQPITAATSTIEVDIDGAGQARIPLCPVRAVTAVVVDGVTVPADQYKIRQQILTVGGHRCVSADVTLDHGYEQTPDDIVRWVCVLAAAQLTARAQSGSISGPGGLASISVDDGRAQFKTGDVTESLVEIPERIQEQLRANYGGGQ